MVTQSDHFHFHNGPSVGHTWHFIIMKLWLLMTIKKYQMAMATLFLASYYFSFYFLLFLLAKSQPAIVTTTLMVCPSGCKWHARSCFETWITFLAGVIRWPLVWAGIYFFFFRQQGIHFRYWVIKFYERNLQRFVGSSAKGFFSLCICVCHCEIVIDNMTGES